MDKLKHGWRRTKESFLQKVGNHEKTHDDDYDHMLDSFEKTQKNTNYLLSNMQQIVANFNAFSTTLHLVSEDFNNIYEEGDEMRTKTVKFQNVSEDLEQGALPNLRRGIQEDCETGLNSYLTEFPAMKEPLKLRDNLLLEYDAYKNKVKDLETKEQKDVTMLPRNREKLARSKDEYDRANVAAKQGMQQVIEKRQHVYDPLLKNMLLHTMTCLAKLADSAQKLPTGKSHCYTPDVSSHAGSSSTAPAKSPSAMYPSLEKSPMKSPMMAPTTPNLDKSPQVTPYGYSDNNDAYIEKKQTVSMQQTNSPYKVPTRAPPMLPTKREITPPEFNFEWFYLNQFNEQQGPVTYLEMKKTYQNGQITNNTHVFGGEMSDWQMISQVRGLRDALSS